MGVCVLGCRSGGGVGGGIWTACGDIKVGCVTL